MNFGKNCLLPSPVLLFVVVLSCQNGTINQAQNRPDALVNGRFDAVSIVYHRFGDKRYPSTNTSVDDFEAQLSYLHENGFKSYTASELLKDTLKLLNGEKKIVITVDDGYISFLTHAWPVLKKYKMKATLFVNTESVGWKDYLSWDQIITLSEEGIEIGNHSHAHTYFVNVSDSIRTSVFQQDLEMAEAQFAKYLGAMPAVYVYPYGEFTPDMVEVLREKKYLAAFAQSSGVLNRQTHRYAIPRFPVAGSHVDLAQFKSKVNMKGIPVAIDAQLPLLVNAGESVEYSVKVENFKRTGPLNCFVAGQSSSQVVSVEADVWHFSTKLPANRRRTLVTVTAQDQDGNWHWSSRLLINPKVKE